MPKPRITSGQRLLRNVLLDHDLGPITLEWMINTPSGPYSVDLYLSRWHVGIEYDGLIHVLKSEEDAIRQAEIVKQGLPILRVTGRPPDSGALTLLSLSSSKQWRPLPPWPIVSTSVESCAY